MKNTIKKPSKKSLYASVTGVILVAVCCFTPLLVVTLGAIGLSVFTPHLDFVLFPALALCIILTIWSYKRYKKECKTCDINNDISNKN